MNEETNFPIHLQSHEGNFLVYVPPSSTSLHAKLPSMIGNNDDWWRQKFHAGRIFFMEIYIYMEIYIIYIWHRPHHHINEKKTSTRHTYLTYGDDVSDTTCCNNRYIYIYIYIVILIHLLVKVAAKINISTCNSQYVNSPCIRISNWCRCSGY